MIKVNLLNDFELAPAEVIEEVKQGRGLFVKLGVPIFVALIAGAGVWYYLNLAQGVESIVIEDEMEAELSDPEKPIPKIHVDEANVVEEVVNDFRKKIVKTKPKKTPLKDYEKIHTQKYVVYHSIKTLKEITSTSIGFGDIVLKVPNYFYVHGLAKNDKVYQRFLNDIRRKTLKLNPLPPKNVGMVGNTLEFSMYGSLNLKPGFYEQDITYITLGEISNIKSQLFDIALEHDVELVKMKNKKPKKTQKYTRRIYKAYFRSNFKNLMNLLSALNKKKYPLGILQISIKADENESMSTVVDFVFYSKLE